MSLIVIKKRYIYAVGAYRGSRQAQQTHELLMIDTEHIDREWNYMTIESAKDLDAIGLQFGTIPLMNFSDGIEGRDETQVLIFGGIMKS